MDRLYYAPGTASMVVHWLLLELGRPHELVRLDFEKNEQRSAEYLALNPAGVVPTLIRDGQVFLEAAAILTHLADCDELARFCPRVGTVERGAYYQWMFFMANTLQPAYRAWFYPTEPAGAANAEATKTAARARIEEAWARVADALTKTGPYLLGTPITAADFMLTMLMRWSRNMPNPTGKTTILAEYAARMTSRPTFRELYAREGLTEWP